MDKDFIIVVDTREQDPFFTGRTAPKGILVVRDSLAEHGGDYSLRGFESNIIIERKSADDFLTSITSDSDRFLRTFDKIKRHEYRMIVVEKEFSKVLSMCDPNALKRQPRTKGKIRPAVNTGKRKIHHNVIMGRYQSLVGKHNIPVYFLPNKEKAEEFTLGVLRKFYNNMRTGRGK